MMLLFWSYLVDLRGYQVVDQLECGVAGLPDGASGLSGGPATSANLQCYQMDLRGYQETWRLGDLKAWSLGNLETWRLGDLETWRTMGEIMET